MSNITLKKRKKTAPRKNTRSSKTSNSNLDNLEYTIKTRKKNKKYIFEVVQGICSLHSKPMVVKVFEFREKAKEFADWHNKNQVWKVNGGLPKFLLD